MTLHSTSRQHNHCVRDNRRIPRSRTRLRVQGLLRLVTIAALLSLTACAATGGTSKNAASGSSPYATPTESMRNPLEAQRLTLEAVAMLDSGEEGTTDEAESLLRQALVADLYHGPAHNNLGVLYLSQDKLYEAASEFEWARRLMPGHPDPRLNLALTFERAGRINEALASYTAALDVYPGHLQTIQAMTRCELRHDRRSDHTHEHLETIALRGATDHWRSWAQQQLTLGRRKD